MLASGALLGLIAGFAARRSWQPLLTVQIRWLPLLIAGLLARAVAALVPAIGFPLYVFALASTAACAAANVRLTGAVLVAAGGALNLAVVVVNRGMPVDPAAVAAAGAVMPTDALHVALGGATQLAVLGDVIPVAFAHAVYSAGDFGIAMGGFFVPFLLLVRR